MAGNNLLCDSCGEIVGSQDERVFCYFKGHEYNFCCDRCAKDWIEDRQDEMNDYLLHYSGLFEYEESEVTW